MRTWVLWFTAALGACTARAGDTPASAPAAAGSAAYAKNCESCHGKDGRGNPTKAEAIEVDPARMDLCRPEAAQYTREQRREIVLKGKEKMPAFERKLKPTEVDPVLEYMMELVAACPPAAPPPATAPQ